MIRSEDVPKEGATAPAFDDHPALFAPDQLWIYHSAGSDGATLVIIDTEKEPDGSDGGPGLRVMVNDGDAFEGVPWRAAEDEEE